MVARQVEVGRRHEGGESAQEVDVVCVLVSQTELLCNDGKDNDGDGLVDWDDPDCATT